MFCNNAFHFFVIPAAVVATTSPIDFFFFSFDPTLLHDWDRNNKEDETMRIFQMDLCWSSLMCIAEHQIKMQCTSFHVCA